MTRTQPIKKRRIRNPQDRRSNPVDKDTKGLHVCTKEEWDAAKIEFDSRPRFYVSAYLYKRFIESKAVWHYARNYVLA